MRPEDLVGRGAATAAAGLRVPVAAVVAAVREVSGERAGPAARALAARWEAALALWAADVVAHGEALVAAGEAYADADGADARGWR